MGDFIPSNMHKKDLLCKKKVSHNFVVAKRLFIILCYKIYCMVLYIKALYFTQHKKKKETTIFSQVRQLNDGYFEF